jgi:Mrp family chromosome partitioning ATPase
VVDKQVNPLFTGRKKVLGELCDQLHPDNQGRDKHKVVVLRGMGGSGKSEVCLKFAHENQER